MSLIIRKCERCYHGTESCIIGNFWVCDICDKEDKNQYPSLKKIDEGWGDVNIQDNWNAYVDGDTLEI